MRSRPAHLVLLGCLALITVLTVTAAPQTGKVWRIGYLVPGSRTAPQHQALFQALRDLGYVEGRTAVFEARYAEGHFDRLPGLAKELVRLKVDVLVAVTNPAIAEAKQATAEIPIVAISHDPVGTGLISSLARPGGNVTGIETLAPQLDEKRVELLKEILPRAVRLGLLYNPTDSGMNSHLQWTTSAAERLNLAAVRFPVTSLDAFTQVFAAITRERPDALVVFTDSLTFMRRKQIAQFAATNRLPAVFEFSEFLDPGGLMAYGPDLLEVWRRAGPYVDKILKGAKPADLPVEQPTTFRLVINLKTVRALGLTIPPSLLLRADQVIE